MTLDDKIHGIRLRVMQQAGVSAVCRELGISRTLLYRWRKRVERYGADGLHPRRRQARPGRPCQLSPQVERLILSVAVAQATWGCSRLAAHLAHRWGLRVAPSTIQRLLRRTKLATRRQRLTVLEHHSARAAGLLTERTRRALLQARYGVHRHVEASTPGELVCLDTFYIGKLKGVGKVWQITACDAATSYGVAWLLPVFSAQAAAHFLERVLLPVYRRAGWRLQRALTDGGPEFMGVFDEVLPAPGDPAYPHPAPPCLDQRLC